MSKSEWSTTAQLIEAAVRILEEQQPMTVRQLFYALVVRGLIANTERDYKRVSRLLTKAREDGRCEWDWIVDRSRQDYQPSVFSNPRDYLQAVKRSYRKDYWQGQPNHCEVWIEKDAVIGSIADLCDELGVGVYPFRGFNSTTKVHQAAERLSRIAKSISVFYLGDHDASGRCIDLEAYERMKQHGSGAFRLRRLAIHKSDIRKFKLPPQHVKYTDSRAWSFREKFGEDCVELDALPPNELRRRIRVAVEGLLDREKWNRAVAVEKAEFASIDHFFEKFPKPQAGV